MPESIKVNVGGLKVGDIIHVKDVQLPPGIRALDEPDAIVIQIKAVMLSTETPIAAAGPAAEAHRRRAGNRRPPREGRERRREEREEVGSTQ